MKTLIKGLVHVNFEGDILGGEKFALKIADRTYQSGFTYPLRTSVQLDLGPLVDKICDADHLEHTGIRAAAEPGGLVLWRTAERTEPFDVIASSDSLEIKIERTLYA